MKWNDIIDETIEQIKTEYIFISKKSVVDFVLGKSLDQIDCASGSLSQERCEVKQIGRLYSHK